VNLRYRATQGADRGLAVLAHASIGFGFFGIGFLLGIAINAVIWLRSRKSSYVAVQAEQAGTYQLLVLLINIALVLIWITALVYVFAGDSTLGPAELSVRQIAAGLWLALIPLFLIWYAASIFYGLWAAYRVSQGKEFWYPIVGSWARRRAERP
jgi:uncharacterized Tic20 family protein